MSRRQTLLTVPSFHSVDEALHAFEHGPLDIASHPSTGWVVLAGLGVSLNYGHS